MRKSIAALSLSFALLLPATALAEGGPGAIDAFRGAQDQVTSLVDKGADSKEIQARVDGLLDYDWLAESALGGKKLYAERCTERCDEYKALLAELIRRNYLKRIKGKDRGTVAYLEEHVRKTATKVDTRVTYTNSEGEETVVEIDYVMHKVDDKWHVRDIITEGVSLAKNYKYEINNLYNDGGMDKVIGNLEKKLAETAEEAPPAPSK